jgi:hypothetical protein
MAARRMKTARCCLHSLKPNHGASEVNEAHEGRDSFLASQGDTSEALEFVEEAFDLMAFLVEAPVKSVVDGVARRCR